jgi:hypothetical protein
MTTSIVDRFTPTNGTKAQKKSLRKLSLQADVPLEKPELLFTQNHNTSRTSTRWFSEALRILQLVFE